MLNFLAPFVVVKSTFVAIISISLQLSLALAISSKPVLNKAWS